MPGSHLRSEVASQPDAWLRAVEVARNRPQDLPSPGARLAVVGCGTSWFMAQAYAALREARGHGLTDAFAASERRDLSTYDAVLAITRSGTTTEVIEVLDELRGRVPTTVVVADASTPVVDLADTVVALDFADERSVVQTRFATSALALLRASLGESLTTATAEARAVLDTPDEELLDGLVDAEQMTFLGRGWTIGLAHEAALKLRESCQAWTESYPAMEYRHGPISIAAPGRVTWAFGEVPDGLAGEVRSTGARFEHREIDPMADLVRLHRLCLMLSARLGLDPDSPRNLTRSIILAGT